MGERLSPYVSLLCFVMAVSSESGERTELMNIGILSCWTLRLDLEINGQ